MDFQLSFCVNELFVFYSIFIIKQLLFRVALVANGSTYTTNFSLTNILNFPIDILL